MRKITYKGLHTYKVEINCKPAKIVKIGERNDNCANDDSAFRHSYGQSAHYN
jgi:hypothetical protein